LHNHIKNISRPVIFTPESAGAAATDPSQNPPRPQGVQLDPSLQKEDESISGGRPPLPKLEDGQKRFRNFAKTGGFNEIPVEEVPTTNNSMNGNPDDNIKQLYADVNQNFEQSPVRRRKHGKRNRRVAQSTDFSQSSLP
jgi:hypothetical protein